MCLSRIGASAGPHGGTAVWSEPGCRCDGGCGYWCWSEYVSEVGEDDGWLLPLDMLESNISRRRLYTSTTFFLFMVDRWSMPLLLQRDGESRKAE